MTTRRCIVSSVGTSLLTNGTTAEQRRILLDTANAADDELTREQRLLIEERVAAARALLSGSVHDLRRASAELNGIYGLYDDQLVNGRADMHLLLSTDTAQGRATAEILAGHLRGAGVAYDVCIPPGLSTRSQAAFSNGIREVIRWCDETLPPYQHQGFRIIFNLVGGFKGLQGCLNTIGMFYADEMVYIFEPPSVELLRIPRLPLRVDLDLLGQERDLLALLAAGHIVPVDRLRDWPEALWEDDGQGMATLSGWGLLVWNREKQALLAERLLRLPRIQYTPAFRRDFGGHANVQERVKLQETLADVAQILEGHHGDTSALKRDGGLQYDNYSGAHADVGHFRVGQGLRVSCGTTADGLVLYHFGKEENVNARPR
jgi:putative CRISPR-associated protein (TIGR02619 family)